MSGPHVHTPSLRPAPAASVRAAALSDAHEAESVRVPLEAAGLPDDPVRSTIGLGGGDGPRRAWIRWITGEGQGRDTEIVGSMLIGRTKACDICVTDQSVSRDHALIGWDNGRLVLVDHGSQNGTFVNNLRIKRCVLEAGDSVRLGQTRFQVRIGEKASGASVVWLDGGRATGMAVEEVIALPQVDDLSLQSIYTSVAVGRTVGVEQRQQLQAHHFAVLFELSQLMQPDSDDVEAVLRRVLSKMCDVVGADRAVLARMDDESQLAPWVVVDPFAHGQAPQQITLLRSAYDRVLADHVAVRVVDAQPASADAAAVGAAPSVRAAIIAPLVVQKQLIGSVEIGAVTRGKTFEDEDTTLVQIAAGMLCTAIERHRLMRDKERTIEQLRRTQHMLAEAQQLNNDLHALKELNDFAGILGHEAKNQLSVITSAVDVIEEVLPAVALDDPEVVSDLKTALGDLGDIVADFVDIARPGALGVSGGQRQFMHQSPRNALVSAMRFARHERSLRGVRCTIKVETERKVYIDPPRLRQVLFNLVRNAGHAMRDGQIEASQAYILLRCCDEGPEGVCLEVQDNGKGMDSAVAQRVYEQGFSAAGKGGLGVGLTVCQRIIQAHGGRIDFDSTPGVGTIFRLHLPGTLPKASSSSQPGGLAPVPSRL